MMWERQPVHVIRIFEGPVIVERWIKKSVCSIDFNIAVRYSLCRAGSFQEAPVIQQTYGIVTHKSIRNRIEVEVLVTEPGILLRKITEKCRFPDWIAVQPPAGGRIIEGQSVLTQYQTQK